MLLRKEKLFNPKLYVCENRVWEKHNNVRVNMVLNIEIKRLGIKLIAFL